MSRSKALKDWSGFASSQYVGRLATIVRGFVVARLLGPTEYGRWLALLMIYDLGSYGHFGILNGMDREIPHELGKGNDEMARRLRDAGYTAVLGITAVILFALLAIDLFGWQRWSSLTRFTLPVIGIALLLQIQCFLYYNIYRATQRIGPISQGMVIQSLINLALSVLLVIYYGVYGLVAALLLANLLTYLFLRRRSNWEFSILPDRSSVMRLLKRGGPVLAYLFVEVLLRQTDKLVIVAFLSRTELGYYGIASTVAGMLVYVTSSASFTLFPKLLAKFGETGEISAIARTLKEPTFAFSIFIPVFLAFVYLWIHIPVVHVLPKFIPGISAMRILVCGTLFLSISSLPSYFLITVNRTKVLLIGGALIVLAEGVLGVSLVKLGLGIQGVALAAAICQFLYGTILLAYALRLVPEEGEHTTLAVLKTYLPTIYVAAVIALLFHFLPIQSGGLTRDIGNGLVHGAILLVATAPLWILLQKRTGVISLAWSMIRRRGEGVQ